MFQLRDLHWNGIDTNVSRERCFPCINYAQPHHMQTIPYKKPNTRSWRSYFPLPMIFNITLIKQKSWETHKKCHNPPSIIFSTKNTTNQMEGKISKRMNIVPKLGNMKITVKALNFGWDLFHKFHVWTVSAKLSTTRTFWQYRFIMCHRLLYVSGTIKTINYYYYYYYYCCCCCCCCCCYYYYYCYYYSK